MTKFEKACEMSLNDWVDSLPDIIPEAEYTERHAKWLNNLFNKMRDNKYHKFTTKTVRLIIAAAIIATLLFTAFAIPSSREFVIENFDVFGTYKLTDSNNNSVSGKISVGYIPEGFELTEEVSKSKFTHVTYSNSNGKTIVIGKYSSTSEVDFNIETVETENIVIDNTTYIYSLSQNNTTNIIWTKNDYIYSITSNISKTEIIEIAKTIE